MTTKNVVCNDLTSSTFFPEIRVYEKIFIALCETNKFHNMLVGNTTEVKAIVFNFLIFWHIAWDYHVYIMST